MAGELSLKTPLTGLVTLVPTNTATDKTITLPATTGTMVVQDGTNTTTVTNLAYTGTLTGGTGVVNLGSGQVYKDALGQLGIGTASPGYRLDVAAGDTTANFGYAMRLRSNATATAATLQFTNSGVTTENGYIRVTDTGLMSFSDKAYITSAGNVGIGTASPTSVSGYTALNIKSTNGGEFQLGNTAGTAQATFWADANGITYTNYAATSHIWVTAASEKMRITASGDVGIGTISPTSTLTVQGTPNGGTVSFKHGGNNSFGTILTLETIGGTDDPVLSFKNYNGGSPVYYGIVGTDDGALGFRSNASTGGFGDERMRITSSGNLLVGTTSPALNSQSTVVGASLGGTFSWAVIHNAADSAVRGILSRCPNYSGDDGYLFIGNRVTSDVIYIKTNGNVLNLNNSYGALSDIKLKENIIDATPKLNNLNQVRVVSYNLKGEHQKQIGVIAQELEQIFPGMVDEMVDRDSEGNSLETTTKAIKYSVFVPMLIKAIQELTARLEVLENK